MNQTPTSVEQKKCKVTILVVGSCSLDRLLAVNQYPEPDSKVRTTHSHESGGGNAANVAYCMAQLSRAKMFSNHILVNVKLLTKIGNDLIGIKLIEELDKAGVDLTSPLFIINDTPRSTTTSVTTVIVSESEQTRTCFHTPGTCGELTLDDIQELKEKYNHDKNNTKKNAFMDHIFEESVVLVHCDSRHTDVAVLLTKEAKKRNIPVSVDIEKDRSNMAQDELIQYSDLICTNQEQMEQYLHRLNNENEIQYSESSNLFGTITYCKVFKNGINNTITSMNQNNNDVTYKEEEYIRTIIKGIQPSSFFSRWYNQRKKQIIITKGNQGAIRILTKSITKKTISEKECSNTMMMNHDTTFISKNNKNNVVPRRHEIEVSILDPHVSHVEETFIIQNSNGSIIENDQVHDENDDCTSQEQQPKDDSFVECTCSYQVHTVGIIQQIQENQPFIIDTTGCGDAFIGTYLLSLVFKEHAAIKKDDDTIKTQLTIHQCLQFASWVAGKKTQVYGARSALPTGHDIDCILGTSVMDVIDYLQHCIGPFQVSKTN